MNQRLACYTCGAEMKPEPGGYAACPNGHGRYDQAAEVVDGQEDEADQTQFAD